MLKEDVQAELRREPFVPVRLHLKGGKTFDIPFPEMYRMLGYGVLVFIGLKPGTHRAKGFDRFNFENIDRIEQLPKRGGSRRRKKAS